jgi:hypothetical protein
MDRNSSEGYKMKAEIYSETPAITYLNHTMSRLRVKQSKEWYKHGLDPSNSNFMRSECGKDHCQSGD